MTHLLSLITEKIIGFIQDFFHPGHVFLQSFSKIKDLLRSAVQLCETWEAALSILTSKFWTSYSQHPWLGSRFNHSFLQDFSARLKEVLSLRTTHELLAQLLTTEEQRELKFEKTLEVFNNVEVLQCSKFNEGVWKSAVSQYWKILIPIEQCVAEKLRSMFSSLQSQPAQLLREYERYSFLVRREIIARALTSERETLLGQLFSNIKKVANELKLKKQEIKGKNIPNAVHIMLQETDRIIDNSISDTNFSSFQSKSFDLSDEIHNFQLELFEEWSSEILQNMDTNNISTIALQQSGRLMDLDYSNGKLRVNYSDRLVTLLREVRQLIALGLPVPAKIQKLAEHAQRYYRHGIVLKQVAHFYNTIDMQMLPCQQTMLLDIALEFESIVRTSKDGAKKPSITWDSPTEVESYISKLQVAADRVSLANRKLRKFHDTIGEHVLNLMSVDLVRNQQKWKETVNVIRSILSSVLDMGIKVEDTQTWRTHWDYQLYKALEFQYKVGLDTINENLLEIKIDIIFKQQKLQFRPSFEEVRAKYYRELKKLINIPTAFRGFGDGKIFRSMVDNNANALSNVYEKAEMLFVNLLKVHDIFKDWVLLGTVEIDGFIEEALDDVPDWENNFRMLKQKGKEAEQLPQSIKVDCITISATFVKSTIDDHLQRVFDSMLQALRKSIHAHYSFIEDFTSLGMDTLMKKPQTLSEIGEANARHHELANAKAKVQHHFEAAEAKNKLLKSVAGSGIDAVAVQARWSKLELVIESHEMMVREQVDSLKGAIEVRKNTFEKDFEKFSSRWNQLKPKPDEIFGNPTNARTDEATKAIEFVKERMREFTDLEKTASQIIEDCGHFEVSPLDMTDSNTLKFDLLASNKMWETYGEYIQEIEEIKKEDWISFRSRYHLFEEKLDKWSEIIRSRIGDADPVLVFIQKQIDKFQLAIPCLKFVRGDTWMSEHWGEMFRIVGMPKGVSLSDLTFGNILSISDTAIKRIEEIKNLNNRANGEVVIRDAIQELDVWGASAVFALTEYIDAKSTKFMLIKDWKDIFSQLGDNLSLLQSLKDSPYYKHFSDKASLWEQKLVELDEYLRNLNNVQRKWVYLEPIFTRGALPSEEHRFSRIDDDFRGIMTSINKDARIISLTSYTGIKEILIALVDQLERCQKALNEFLEQKREKFARFYFIGDEDLLEILGQAKNPNVIQAHLKKLFAGVHTVQFDKDITSIISMKSLDGEVVTLRKPVIIGENVETWLQSFSTEMQETLKNLLNQCMTSYDIFKFPSQILGVADYLKFTTNCEEAINMKEYDILTNSLKKKLNEYTSFDSSQIQNLEERKVSELKIKSLILDIIHFMDVVKQLQKTKVSSVIDWEWQRQLRYYFTNEKGCFMKMNSAEFMYTFEYQGNPPKLVHTPLTDKCFLTLTQAMSSGFGGNPFGPAGTGKTESVKALGVLFGRQVLVFNCDEGIDYKSMGRIFVGLVKCGAWGCFDEFNRLESIVIHKGCLSAVSQQIQVIQFALKSNSTNVNLLEKIVDLNPNSGIFVTLNPAGKHYGGRQNLPDNLKQLFRSVAMTHPDNELISEVMLYSEGFQLGKELGSKVVSVFTLCKQLLSQQQHYDWGLRPLKTTLWLAGHLLHEEKKKGPVSNIGEAAILVQAFRVNTLSKLTFSDSQRFNELMTDIFPGVPFGEIDNQEFFSAMNETYSNLNLEFSKSQAEKAYQFYEACKQRMGVVVVGPSGSGKSTLIEIVKTTWVKLGQKIMCHTVNPKAIDRRTLLGHMDMDTREWFDGVLTFASREAVKQPQNVVTWVICDGDVDPEWIESLNSVLDDNRLLTIPNGERIQFGRNVNFIFETDNLKFASPATVSRMGMIYLSDETLDVKLLIKKWINKLPENKKALMTNLINDYFHKSLDWIHQNCEFVIETTKTGLVMNGLSHLLDVNSKIKFVFGLIRGFGANLQTESRINFANELLKWIGETGPQDPKRILDYFVNKNDRLEMYQLKEPQNQDMHQLQDADRLAVVETVDVKRVVDIILPWLTENHPILLVGPEGAGKQMILKHCFSKLRSTSIAVINCSAQTRSSHVLQRISQNCLGVNTTTGRVLKPKEGDRLILYLKDINLPKPDKYETVELIQFLQQLMTFHGYYDSNLEWVWIENIQIVASMNPSSMGRHKLTSRFSSIIRLCSISYTDRDQLQAVYRIIATPVIGSCMPGHKIWGFPKSSQKIANTMVNIFDHVVQKYTIDMQPHYLFTPRDLSRWIIGISRYQYTSEDPGELLDVLAFEAQRLFSDRLIGVENKQKFVTMLNSIIQSEWGHKVSLKDSLFISVSNSTVRRLLRKVSREEFNGIVLKAIQIYERDVKDLNMCLFPEALELISKIDRTLSQPGGSMLLAGRAGIGRRNAVAIVAHMIGMQLFSPCIGKCYTSKHFTVDLKQVLQISGIQGEDTLLVLEDQQLSIDPSFLESINSLLSGGEVPGLYSQEEIDQLLSSNLKDQHSEAGFRGSLFEFFVSRVRIHLHIVLIMDYTSPHFVANCESNPALYTRCTLDWFESWSPESMFILAKTSFDQADQMKEILDAPQIIKQMMAIHLTCCSNVSNSGATPRHFVQYISTYKRIFCEKKEGLLNKQRYLGGGLTKLRDAVKYVDTLKQTADKKKIELDEKQRQADLALKQITDSMMKAEGQKKEMEKLSKDLGEEERKLEGSKIKIERELSEVEPIVKSAQEAVGSIKSESLTEIRSLRAPPPAIRDVLEGVLRLMGILDMSWNSMKGFLGKRTIKDEIMNFDVRNITKSVRESVNQLMREKRDSFDEVSIKRVSVAAAPLAMWVKANIRYSTVLESIGPLETELARLTKTLDVSRERVKKLQNELSLVDQTVAGLRDNFGNKTREAETLRSDLEKATGTIMAAEGLIEKLSSENKRWAIQIKSINEGLNYLPKNVLLSAAFVTYLGGSSVDRRAKILQDWKKIAGFIPNPSNSSGPFIPEFNLLKVMSTESEQLVWKSEGLPSDTLSFENSIVILNSSSVPLIVDPSRQAASWLKIHLKDRNPEVVNQHDDNFLRTLELAVRFGKTLVVQELNEIEPILYPILRKDLLKQGPRFVVQLGEKTVDYNENFKLYLVTRKVISSINEASSLINEINFTVTRQGLAGQLLGVILKHEKPELEVEKVKLLKKEDELKIQLSTLEESLLKELANSEGNILENKGLIESLNETKEKSTKISVGLEESQRLQTFLDAERDKFASLSSFGSELFFVVSDLLKINNMYQFSLQSFLRLFEKALKSDSSTTKDGTELRIKLLTSALEKLTYHYVSRSIFKADRPMFALHLVHELHNSLFEAGEWDLFIGQILVTDSDEKGPETPLWILDELKSAYKIIQVG
ncbi:Cytoplasmic dynein 2 heavy chain 1 [Nowakowskiella sp. JEL0078]|nr:Cytoplasmic dynein 2 heavy chain 1 [Nowakowskiella sp. JEL0078]